MRSILCSMSLYVVDQKERKTYRRRRDILRGVRFFVSDLFQKRPSWRGAAVAGPFCLQKKRKKLTYLSTRISFFQKRLYWRVQRGAPIPRDSHLEKKSKFAVWLELASPRLGSSLSLVLGRVNEVERTWSSTMKPGGRVYLSAITATVRIHDPNNLFFAGGWAKSLDLNFRMMNKDLQTRNSICHCLLE